MDNTKVMNLYTPESNFRKTVSKYNAAAKTQSVSAIRGYQRWLGGAQDDREEREQLQQAIASTKEVRSSLLALAHAHLAPQKEGVAGPGNALQQHLARAVRGRLV